MKNHDEMYQSLLSRYSDYQEKKKKRIRTIRRTVPVLVCFCLSVVFIPMIRDDLAKLPSVQIGSGIVDDLSRETSESSTTVYIADATESRSTDQIISTNAVSTAVSFDNTETDRIAATGATQTVTTAVSVDDAGQVQKATEHRETIMPVTNAPVIQSRPITGIQTTSPVQTTMDIKTTAPVTQTRPITGIQTTSPVQTTMDIKTTAPVIQTRPITEIQTTSLVQTTAKSPETTDKKNETTFPQTTKSMVATIPQTTNAYELTIPQTTETETTIPQTTTALHNNTCFDVDYTAVILDGICFWNTHEIITSEIDEDIILYYEKENTILDIAENTTHIKTPEWGTRYYILNENEVAVEIDRKWMVFRRH